MVGLIVMMAIKIAIMYLIGCEVETCGDRIKDLVDTHDNILSYLSRIEHLLKDIDEGLDKTLMSGIIAAAAKEAGGMDNLRKEALENGKKVGKKK